jgi:hypothetical protein
VASAWLSECMGATGTEDAGKRGSDGSGADIMSQGGGSQ